MDFPTYLRKTINRFPWSRTIVLFLADIVLIVFSVWFSFFLRFEGTIPVVYLVMIRDVSILSLFFCIPIFYFVGLYSFSWSYVGIKELISVIKASVIAFVFLAATLYLSQRFPQLKGFPRSTLVTSFFLIIILCSSARFAKRIYKEIFRKNSGKEKTLIVGAGDAGEQILRSILSAGSSEYMPVGFADDNPSKKGIMIHGLKVLGKISDIPEIVEDFNIESVVVALPSAGSKLIKNAVELARNAGIKKIKVIPTVTEIISGNVTLANLKDVDSEDLLSREPVVLNTDSINSFIKNSVVLITGAAGSIGSELCRQVAQFNPSLMIILDQDETGIFNISNELGKRYLFKNLKPIIADVTDEKKINEIFKDYKPKIVFHAAAYKHVPLMEENPDEAVKNNIFGTKAVAQASLENGAEKFIFISTDKAVNPSSIMGATKRVAEQVCQSLNQAGITKFISVRFGNVLDSRGSVIPIFREQIKRGGPVEVTHKDMKRYFMLTSEACLLVMQAGAMGNGGEVFVLDMGKPVKIWDLAKEMIKLSGLQPDKDIAIVFTGIRPGEKLFEEILTAEEGVTATKNQRIFMAHQPMIQKSSLESSLSELKKAVDGHDNKKICDIIKKITPFYSEDTNKIKR